MTYLPPLAPVGAALARKHLCPFEMTLPGSARPQVLGDLRDLEAWNAIGIRKSTRNKTAGPVFPASADARAYRLLGRLVAVQSQPDA